MRTALQQGDRPALLRQAHSMKGLLQSFEAHAAADAAGRLQALAEAAGQPDGTTLAGALAALDDELALLLPLLRRVADEGLGALA
jgi:HPt (histidine-containing phosphotransfer) domain-containing protein